MENNNTEALVVQGETAIINQSMIQQMKAQYDLLRKFTTSVLEEGKDFGTIPGIEKPSLFQSGAISLKIAYGLAEDVPVLTSVIQHLDKTPPYVEYIVRQDIRSIKSGIMVSSTMASCNSYEDKYRYRWIPEWKLSEEQKKVKNLQPSAKRKKKDGNWFTVYRFDNEDIYSQFNTILQMAEKRAFVRAIRQAVPGASKLYTQDVEDLGSNWEDEETKETKIDYVAEITRLMEVTGITPDGMKELATKNNWKVNASEEGKIQRYEHLKQVADGMTANQEQNLTPEAPGSTIPEKAVESSLKQEIVQPTPTSERKPDRKGDIKGTPITDAHIDELKKNCADLKVNPKDILNKYQVDSWEHFFEEEIKMLKNTIAVLSVNVKK